MAVARSGYFALMRAASSSRSACLRLERTTWAPCSTSAVAMALPIPRLAPVTRATRPDRSNRELAGTADTIGDSSALSRKFLASSRPWRPGAIPPHRIWRFRGDPGGAEGCVKGPGAASLPPRDQGAGTPKGCAPPCATLSLPPAADAAKYAADLRYSALVATISGKAAEDIL